MANALTAVRLLLVLPFGILTAGGGEGGAAVMAAVLFVAAIATDLLDGRVARRTNTASAFGGTFDHATDWLFVMSGLIAGATRGVFPWVLPALVAMAFGQYFIDSRWLSPGPGLRRSQLGRYNGILYFAPLGGDILVRLGLRFLRPVLTIVSWLLVLSTVVSICQRLLYLRGSRGKGPSLPVEERSTRSSH
jgi:phosphatidylglycerophosphate synthase